VIKEKLFILCIFILSCHQHPQC